MSTNVRTRWTLLLCVCINQNTNGTFIVVSQLLKYIYFATSIFVALPDFHCVHDCYIGSNMYFCFFKLFFLQLTGDCDRFYTAKVACYSLLDNFMKYLLRNSVFPIFILTAYLYFADLVQTSKL
jgi:hypothetical protein